MSVRRSSLTHPTIPKSVNALLKHVNDASLPCKFRCAVLLQAQACVAVLATFSNDHPHAFLLHSYIVLARSGLALNVHFQSKILRCLLFMKSRLFLRVLVKSRL